MVSQRARELRRNPTEAEKRLWYYLRRKQVEGYRFRRQRPIGRYVADFVCLEASLIIEIDGGQHAEQVQADATRTRFLETQGFRVIRFWNNEVLENTGGVVQTITRVLAERHGG